MEAIASGKSWLSEIAGPVGLPTTSLSKYVRELSDVFDIIERQVPVTNGPVTSKKSRYKIRNPFITFWMRFVYRQLSLYEAGNYNYCIEKLDTYLAEFMGLAFEGIVKELLRTLNLRGEAPKPFHRIGRWWWHRGTEINLVALNQETREALFVECKWTNTPVNLKVLHELEDRSKQISINPARCLRLLASKSGFSK